MSKKKKEAKKTEIVPATVWEWLVNPVSAIYHDGEKYLIEAQLPGVKKKDIEIEAVETSFCIKGHKKNVLYSACYSLAHEVDLKRVEAAFKDGILTVNLPLKKPVKTVKIAIK
ncbi:MAG TPA: Hsp20/alpha crystallin family protein [Candidatus Eisenbacteria bacterium]|nr:Hsp20/alpha crystallin family protein [Candidatus Eisenbacteria bacterium]